MKNRRKTEDVSRYALSGMAAFLPGMQYMVELMQRQLDEFREELAYMQGLGGEPEAEPEPVAKKIGRPSGGAAKSGWSADPKERKAEMARRMAVAATKKATHPRDPNHPKHAQWVRNLQKSSKAYWGRLSKAEKEQKLASMVAARSKPKLKKKAAPVTTVREHLARTA